ncbi:DUF397 domain-containing protein [Streptomyces sp. NPDC004609]|uniref:DUF397 domain-containing protein n=1 Tax=Streptomyces sp. NPDC004609 TaxID=3364704 RepID=UPI003685EDC8
MTPNGSVRWIKSSYSSQEGGNCLEWAPTYAQGHSTVAIRDSKNPHAPSLTLEASAWSPFVYAIKNGGLSGTEAL